MKSIFNRFVAKLMVAIVLFNTLSFRVQALDDIDTGRDDASETESGDSYEDRDPGSDNMFVNFSTGGNVHEYYKYPGNSAYGYGDLEAVITDDHVLYLKGDNKWGDLAQGNTDEYSDYVKVLENVKSYDHIRYYDMKGAYSIALTIDGKLYVWGNNKNLKYIDSEDEIVSKPVCILENVKEYKSPDTIGHGNEIITAITNNGELYTWGDNVRGKLARITDDEYSCVPGKVNVSGSVEGIYGQDNFVLGVFILTSDHMLYSCGGQYSNNKSATPKGFATNIKRVFTPGIIYDGSRFGGVSIQHDIIAYTDLADNLWVYADQNYCYLVDGGISHTNTVTIPNKRLTNVKDCYFITGPTSTLLAMAAITNEGDLYTWGDNLGAECGVIGGGDIVYNPTKVLQNVGLVKGGGGQIVAVTEDGGLFQWGTMTRNTREYTYIYSPANTGIGDIVGVEICSSIGGGNKLSAISNTGDLYVWGDVYNSATWKTKKPQTPVLIDKDVDYIVHGNESGYRKKDGSYKMYNFEEYNEVSEKTYKVFFDGNGGIPDIDEMETTTEGRLEYLPKAIKENEKFVGWFSDPDGGEEITTDTIFTEDCTIYAHWVSHERVMIKPISPANGSVDTRYTDDGGFVSLKIEFSTDVPVKKINTDTGKLRIIDADSEKCIYESKGTGDYRIAAYGKGSKVVFKYMFGGLEFNHNYYITIDNGFLVFDDPDLISFIDKNDWVFSLCVMYNKIIIRDEHYGYDKELNYWFKYSDLFFDKPACEYNHDRFIWSFGLAMAGFESYTGIYNKGYYNAELMLKRFGFENGLPNEDYKKKPEQYTFGVYCASKKIDIITDGQHKDYTLIAVATRGAGYEAEWYSNAIVGKGNYHQGFKIASDKVLEHIKDYITTNDIHGDIKLVMAGYSRAGAVTNLSAARIDEGELKRELGYLGITINLSTDDVYAYCFEAPAVTKTYKLPKEEYNNISCFINIQDVVPMVPLAQAGWDYGRYGMTYYIPSPVFNSTNYFDYKENFKENHKKVFGYEVDDKPVVRVDSFSRETTSVGAFLPILMSKLYYAFPTSDEFAEDAQEKFAKLLQDSFTGSKSEGYVKGLIKLVLEKHVAINRGFWEGWTAYESNEALFQKHEPAYNFAWMVTLKGETDYNSGGWNVVLLNCPINVDVYNSSGQLVASIVNDEPIEIEDSYIDSYIDENQQKVLILPKDDDFSIKVKATGDGKMDYSVVDYSVELSRFVKKISYYDVPITAGEEFGGVVKEDGSVTFEDKNGLIDESEIRDGTIPYYDVTVNVSGSGRVEGGGLIQEGNHVLLSAIADEGAVFNGWYDLNDELVNKEEDYRFRVDSNIELTAKFIPDKDIPVSVNRIILDKQEIELTVGGEGIVLNATVEPENASGYEFEWSSSSEEVASVSSNGLVSPVGVGEAVITVTADDCKAECKVKVTAVNIKPANEPMNPVTDLSRSTVYLVKGQKFKLPGTGWTSSDKKIVSISKKGVLTAKKITTTPIKISGDGKVIDVYVSQPKMVAKSITLQVGNTKSIGFNYDSENLSVQWYCNTPDIATVSDDGEVCAVGKGTATIVAYVNGSAYSCKVKVMEDIPAIERTLHMTINTKKTISIKGVKKVTWVSDEETIVSVAKKNKVTAVTTGETVLRTEYEGKEYRIKVYVEDPTITSKSIQCVGKNKYKVTISPGTTTDIEFASIEQPVIFKSSKGETAYVNAQGTITANRTGKAKLTAKINGKPITITVLVQ